MQIVSEGEWLVTDACAKINLFLDVVKKRSDGFHDLQTVFAPVDFLYDTLKVTHSKIFSLKCNTADIPLDGSNLIIKAARLLADHCGIDSAAEFELIKRIPDGGGLGGGSSDAAAALLLCNRLWETGLTVDELAALALLVGSDVPYFLYGGICYAEGRGEKLTPMDDICLPPVAVFIPEWKISTALAFENLNPENFGQGNYKSYIESLSVGDFFSRSYNAFEQAVFSFEPKQKNMMEALVRYGCSVRMSGSGSCCWLLVDDNVKSLPPELKARIIFPDMFQKQLTGEIRLKTAV